MILGVTEVSRTETNREIIFKNVKQGFAAAYDSLVLDPKERVNLNQIYLNSQVFIIIIFLGKWHENS